MFFFLDLCWAFFVMIILFLTLCDNYRYQDVLIKKSNELEYLPFFLKVTNDINMYYKNNHPNNHNLFWVEIIDVQKGRINCVSLYIYKLD